MYASLKKTTPYLFFSDLVDLEFHLLFLQLLQMPGFEPSAWLGIPPCKSTWHSRKTIQPTQNSSYPRLPNTLETYHGRSYKMGIGKPVISEGYKIPKIFFTPVTPIYFQAIYIRLGSVKRKNKSPPLITGFKQAHLG